MKKIFVVFIITGGVLMFVFSAAQQYADNSAVPRFCADQAGVIERVGNILTPGKPVGDRPTRPFITAAKLIFLIPQRDTETVETYLERLSRHLVQVC